MTYANWIMQLPNIVADKVGPINTIIAIAFITGAVGFSWIGVTGQAGVITFGVVYGFFSGSYVALTAVVWAALSPNPRVLGTRIVCLRQPAQYRIDANVYRP